MIVRGRRVVVCVGLSLAVACSTAQAGGWLGSADMTLPGPADTHSQPAIAMSPNGNVAVGWISFDNANKPSLHLMFRPRGGPPEAVKVASPFDNGTAADHLSLAVNDNGDAIAAWQETATIGYAVHRAGQGWGGAQQPPQYVFTNLAVDPAVGIAADGTATLAYGSQCNLGNSLGSGAHVYVMTLPPSGSWSSPHAVDDVLNSCGDGTIYDSLRLAELPDGRAVLAARRASTDGSQRFSLLSGRRGSADAQFTSVTESASGHPDHPAVAIEPGGASIVTWADDSGVQVDLYPGSGSNVKTAIGVANSVAPEAAFGAGGEAFVASSLSSGGNAPSVVRISPTGVPDSAQTLGAGIGSVTRPVIAADTSGTALVVYRNAGDAGLDAWLRPPGGAFARSTTLGSGIADFPALATDGAGDFSTLWLAITVAVPDTAVPAIAVYDGAPPQIAGLATPTPLAPGANGSFTASATDVWGPLTLGWTFGDGASADGGAVQHAYSAPGVYTARFAAADGAGNRATASADVNVQAPAIAQPPPSGGDMCAAPRLVRKSAPSSSVGRQHVVVDTGRVLVGPVGAGCRQGAAAALVLRALLAGNRPGLGRSVVIARRRTTVARGRRVAVKLELTKDGARLLRARKHLTARLTASVAYGAAKTVSAEATLKIRAPTVRSRPA